MTLLSFIGLIPISFSLGLFDLKTQAPAGLDPRNGSCIGTERRKLGSAVCVP